MADPPGPSSASSSQGLQGASSAPSSPDFPGPSSAPSSPDLPGPSSAPISLSKDAENYCRLCQLIITVCSDLFRDIFSRHIQPGNLRGELDRKKNTLLSCLRISKHKSILFPSSGGQFLSSKDMDLSLLYTLLRNMCGIPSHQAGWGNTPNPGDYSLAASIERIREQKNAMASHSEIAEIDYNRFQDIWQSLEKDIVNIERILTGGDKYKRTVSWLFSCHLSPSNALEYVREIKDEIIDEMQSQKRQLHSSIKQVIAGMNDIKKRQYATKRKLIGASTSKKGASTSKKARITRLEKQQSSATLDIKETLKETEHHILNMVQGRLTGNEERLEGRLSAIEGTIKGTLSEIQEYMADRLTKIQEYTEGKLSAVDGKLSAMDGKLSAMDGRLSAIERNIKDVKTQISSLVMTSSIYLPDIGEVEHISPVTPGVLWVSDGETLKQVDSTGKVIRTLDDKYKYISEVNDFYASQYGGHAVSGDRDLVFIAEDPDSVPSTTSGSRRRGVYKMTSDGNITCLFTTDELFPLCLYCSHINGDILIGMSDRPHGRGNALVRRCNNTGRKIQDIELDDAGKRLYHHPRYITENRKNGDILVSDEQKRALVVVDRSGRHRFDYTGRSTNWNFSPIAVCTDFLGRILVAHKYDDDDDDEDDDNEFVPCISLLDIDGHYLARLLIDEYNRIRSVCVDDNHNIYVGYESKIKSFQIRNRFTTTANV